MFMNVCHENATFSFDRDYKNNTSKDMLAKNASSLTALPNTKTIAQIKK